jgi:guanylate kinase
MVASDEFLEWAEVHGNRYGTRLSDVKRVLDTGRDILLEIDVQGCRQVKAHWPDAIRIFITAPSLDELECRLVDRGTEDDDELGLRLRNAADEMRHASEYDRIIVNGDVDRASAELIGVMRKYRQGEIR